MPDNTATPATADRIDPLPDAPAPEAVDGGESPSNGNGAAARHVPPPGITPMVRERRTMETTYPAGTAQSPLDPAKKGRASQTDGPEYQELKGRSKDCAELLLDLTQRRISHPEEVFKVNLIRRAPRRYVDPNGASFILETGNVIHEYDPNPFPDIKEWVLEEFGGGEYALEIIKEGENKLYGKLVFKIDIDQYPPQADQPASFKSRLGARLQNPMTYGGPRVDGESPEQENLKKLRYEQMATEAQLGLMEKRSMLSERAMQIEERRRMKEEAERQAAERPLREKALREEAERREEKSELRRLQEDKDKLMLNVLATMGRGNGGDNGMAAVLAAAIQSSSATMAKVLETVAAKKDDGKEDLLLKMVMALMTSQQQGAAAQTNKMEGLFEKILLMKLEQPADQVKNALSMMDKGEERAMKFFEMMQDREGGDDFEMDPDAGFLGNMGNLAVFAIKNLVKRAGSGGSTKILEWLQLLTRRPGATQFSDAEIAAAAPRIQPYLTADGSDVQPVGYLAGQSAPAPALPGPAPVPAAPVYQPAPQPVPAAAPLPIASNPPTTTAVIAQRAVPYVAAVHQTTPPPQAVPVAAAPVQVHAPAQTELAYMPSDNGQDEVMADDRAGIINEMLEMALNDIKGERRMHLWPNHAVNYFDKELRVAIARVTDDNQWFAIIQQFADPTLFNQVVGILMMPQNIEHFRRFSQGIAETVASFKEDVNATA